MNELDNTCTYVRPDIDDSLVDEFDGRGKFHSSDKDGEVFVALEVELQEYESVVEKTPINLEEATAFPMWFDYEIFLAKCLQRRMHYTLYNLRKKDKTPFIRDIRKYVKEETAKLKAKTKS